MRKYIGAIIYRIFLLAPVREVFFIISLCLSYGAKINAAEITCSSGSSPAPVNVEISPVNVTISSHIADYTILYTLQQRIVGDVVAYCFSTPAGGNVAITANTLTNLLGSADSSQSGYLIFPTNINGIGISVNSASAGNAAIPAWPSYQVASTSPMGNTWRHQNVIIRIWKIPGDIPDSASPVGIVGPTVLQGIMPASPSDYLDPSTMTADRALSTDFWIISQRNLMGTANYYIGTCNLKKGNQTVLLGKHFNFTRFSEWRDASFDVECPTKAWGYGGKNNVNSGENNPNRAPSIKVIPYSSTIVSDYLANALNGTIALEAGGAQGYGVQLAWGDYSTQGSGVNPAKPVTFNIPISLNSLVAGYPATITPIGSTAKPATIKMAARFIQTEAIPQAGPARAAVEVIVNYE